MNALCVLMLVLPSQEADTLRVSWGLPTSLDPHRAVTLADSRFVTAIYEGLTTHGPDGVTVAPGMAEKWEVFEDGRALTFTIRDAKWSNGDDVTAHDFVRAWRRALNPGTACPYTVLFRPIRNVGAYLDGAEADRLIAELDDLGKDDRAAAVRRLSEIGSNRHAAALRKRGEEAAAGAAEKRRDVTEDDLGFVAGDRRRLHVRLERPMPGFLDRVSFMTFVPMHTASGPEKPIGNGPYLLDSSSPVNLKFRRNPAYWDPRTRNAPAGITAWLNSPEVALEKFLGGRLDWLTGDQIPFEKRGGLKGLVRYDTWGTFFLRFNVRVPPTQRLSVRQAIAQAIDRAAVAGKASLGAARGIVPPGFPGYTGQAGPAMDRAAAMEGLLRATEFDLSKIPRLELLTDDSERSVAAAEEVRAQLEKALALRVRVVSMKWPAYRRTLAAGEFQFALDGWMGDEWDPSAFLEIWMKNHPANTGGWTDAGFEVFLRQKDLARAEGVLLRRVALVPLFHTGDAILATPRVRGLSPNLMSRFPIKYVRLRE